MKIQIEPKCGLFFDYLNTCYIFLRDYTLLLKFLRTGDGVELILDFVF